eukprot:Stramenopile-MAST_4_protein_3189
MSISSRKGKVTPADVSASESGLREVKARVGNANFAPNLVITSRYNIFSFIPLNLWIQFHRVANIYFLLIMIIQTIPAASTTNGVPTNLAPLTFVLGVSAIKDALEDYRRHKADDAENNRSSQTISESGEEERKKWRDIKVGDLVKVKNRELIPADLILLGTSDPQGCAFIMTANLDGETNLKLRKANPDIFNLGFNVDPNKTLKACAKFQGNVQCLNPNKNLEVFDSTLRVDGREEPVSLSKINTLLRGCQVRNTDWIVGLAVYTGSETKIQKNVEGADVKFSSFSKIINRQTILMGVLFVALCTFCAVMAASTVETLKTADYLWGGVKPGYGATFAARFGTYAILLSNLIPISLLVTMDMVKFLQSMFVQWDRELYFEELDCPMQVRTLDLLEELGMIEHVFSDKTGTLTSNSMDFRKCTVAGIEYGRGSTQIGRSNLKRQGLKVPPEPEPDPTEPVTPNVNFIDSRVRQILSDPNHPEHQAMYEFFLHLSLNHDVMPERPNGPGSEEIVYSASSPDEGAFVNGAKHFGFFFHTRTPKSVTINIMGQDKIFKVLHVLEFSSKRKRSSVIVERDDGSIILYTKGADNVIKERMAKSGQLRLKETEEQLDAYAAVGLRTLLIAKRDISKDEYDKWVIGYKEASSSMVKRLEKMESSMDAIEVQLQILGATAIEDMLQDGVDDTLTALREAGVKVWVLTGDKVDTAINIGYACALLTRDMKVFRICGEDMQHVGANGVPLKEAMEELLQKVLNETKSLTSTSSDAANVGVILDTYAIMCIMDNDLSGLLLEIGDIVKSVICARVSPSQKAEIVSMCRNNRAVKTLAIGDGANDVPMILRAHVGVGIFGKEGLQAVNNSDFAIGQFRFLKPLMLVHGRWCYRRVAIMIYYMFYKNVAALLPQFFSGMSMHFSGQRMYYEWLHQGYNIFNTGLPVLLGSALDQDVSRKEAMQNPRLYEDGRKGRFFTVGQFWWHIFEGFLHALIVYAIIVHSWGYSQGIAINMGAWVVEGASGSISLGLASLNPGQTSGLWMMGTMTHLILTWVVTIKLLLQLRHWNAVVGFCIFISVGGYYFEMLMFGEYLGSYFGYDIEGLMPVMIGSPMFHLLSLICCILCMFTSFIPEAYQNLFNPRLWNVLMEKAYGYGVKRGKT